MVFDATVTPLLFEMLALYGASTAAEGLADDRHESRPDIAAGSDRWAGPLAQRHELGLPPA
jgi:hypothetical protein